MNITKTNLGHATGTCYAHRPAHGTQKQVRRPVVFFSQSLHIVVTVTEEVYGWNINRLSMADSGASIYSSSIGLSILDRVII